MKLISKGAEAEIYSENNKIIKKRIKKNYRITELDIYLRKKRNKAEKKLLEKSFSKGINVPRVIDSGEFELTLEEIKGRKIKDIDLDNNTLDKISREIASLHNENIIHGDLTSSNIILKDKIYVIDFGLGFVSNRIEDKATDLRIFLETLELPREKKEEIRKTFLEYYKKYSNNGEEIISQLEDIEKRGRYVKRKSA